MTGLKENKSLDSCNNMIINLKLLSFFETSEVKEYFKRIKENFNDIDEKFEIFLDYFENTWLSGGVFDIQQWNYSSAVLEEEEGDIKINDRLHFTNNSVEGLNSIINRLLTMGNFSFIF